MSQILKEKQPTLLKSSEYRDHIMDIVDIIRTKSYKYQQAVREFQDIRNRNRVCAMGLYYLEKYGSPWNGNDFMPVHYMIEDLNDKGWTFNQIADELERGVSIIR
jgi:hypothetical protein